MENASPLMIAAMGLLTVGSVGGLCSMILEWRLKRNFADIAMKACSLIFGGGGVLFGVAWGLL